MHTSLAAGPLRSAMLGRGIRFPCCIAASAPLTTTTISPPTKHIEFPRSVANLSTKCSTFSKKPLTHSSVREKHPLIEKTSATSQPAQSIITSSLRRNFSNSANLQASPSTSPSEAPLDWNTFFKLRASRRRYSLISSVLASITSTAAGVQILSAQDLDALGAQVMGLDPFIVLGLATAAFGAMGWLIGPVLGNAVWGLVHRQYRRGVAIVGFLISYLQILILIISYWQCFWNVERKRILQPNQALPCWPVCQLDCESGSGLLRREDWQCARVSTMAERSASIQQEEVKASSVIKRLGSLSKISRQEWGRTLAVLDACITTSFSSRSCFLMLCSLQHK